MSNITASQFVNTYRTIEELKQALSQYDKETLIDTLVYVIDGYIINSETNVGANRSNINDKKDGLSIKHESFCSLISQVKKDYSFSELEFFTVENDKVFFNFDDRKIEIKGMTFNTLYEKKADHKADEPVMSEMPEETYKRFSNLEVK